MNRHKTFTKLIMMTLLAVMLVSLMSMSTKALVTDSYYGALYFSVIDGKFHADSYTGELYSGQSDRWSWDAATQTLTLNNFEWSTNADGALQIDSSITLKVEGENQLISSRTGLVGTNVYVCGSGVLNVIGGDQNGVAAVYVSGSLFIYGGATLNIDAGRLGIYRGVTLFEGTLIIRTNQWTVWNYLNCMAPEYTYWINDVNSEDPGGEGITYPAGAPYAANLGSKFVKISTVKAPVEVKPYGLIFNTDTGVFTTYYDSSTPQTLYVEQPDKWDWDAETKTLTLNGFEFNSANNGLRFADNIGGSSTSSTMTLSLKGINTIRSTFTSNTNINSLNVLLSSVTVTGNGELHIINDVGNCAIIPANRLIINGGSIIAQGPNYATNSGLTITAPVYTWWTNTEMSDPGGLGTRYPDDKAYVFSWADKFVRVDARSKVFLSGDATLSTLVVSEGTLAPAFDPDITSYTVAVQNSVSSITIAATANDKKAAIQGVGTKALDVGANIFNIVVTAEDGSELTYTITVIREAAPVFLSQLDVQTYPKLVYVEGENLDLTGMVVAATFSDGSTKPVTNYITAPVNGAQLNAMGEQTVTVSYTEEGITKTCSFTITITPHTHDWTKKQVVEPTCETQGYTLYECLYCDETKQDSSVPMLGHDFSVFVSRKAATCEEAGEEIYRCSRCDKLDTTTLPVLGHVEGEGVVTVEPTCETEGVLSFFCTRCSKLLRTEDIVALGHDYKDEVTTPATCTEEGVVTYTCSRCGDSYTETIVKREHDWVMQKIVEPTCIEEGYTVFECSLCKEIEDRDLTVALGHDYKDEVTTPATCTEEGVMTYTCSRCGDSYTESIAKLEHNWMEKTVVEPTCTELGYTVYECSLCKETENRDSVAALGHDYVGTDTTPATCTEEGVITYTCSRCGDSYTETIAKLGHDWVIKTVVKPTCTVDGYTMYECSLCGVTKIGDLTDALGHLWDNGVITIAATETSEGLMTYTCLRCGETRTEVIPKLDSSIVALLQKLSVDVMKAKKGFNDLSNADLVLTGKTLTLVVDGRAIILSTNANNRNQSGQIDIGDGYILVFDIKGNGSNVKTFSVIKK